VTEHSDTPQGVGGSIIEPCNDRSLYQVRSEKQSENGFWRKQTTFVYATAAELGIYLEACADRGGFCLLSVKLMPGMLVSFGGPFADEDEP